MEEFKKITFDVNREIRTIYQIAQYDESTRGLIVTYQSDGVDKEITTEKLVFQGLKADGKKIIQEAEVIDGKFVVSLPRQAATMPGVMLAQLTLLGERGERLSDKKFKIVVDRDIFGEGLISEDERGILDRAFDFAQDIMPRIEALDIEALESKMENINTLIPEVERLIVDAETATENANLKIDEMDGVTTENTTATEEAIQVLENYITQVEQDITDVIQITQAVTQKAETVTENVIDKIGDIVPRLEALDVQLLENLEQEVTDARHGEVTLGKALEKIKDGEINDSVITPYKTTFFEVGKNKFNKKTVINGHYVSSTNGLPYPNDLYSYSDYIPVEGGAKYTRTYNNQVAYFDEAKQFLSGINDKTNHTITIPTNAKYAVLTVASDLIDTFQFEKGEMKTEYEPYSIKIPKELINANDLFVSTSYRRIADITSKLVLSSGLKKVKMIGDSITHGSRGTGFDQDGEHIMTVGSQSWNVNEKGYCWANLLKQYLEQKFNCQAKNFGTVGANSTTIVSGLPQLITGDEDIVICMIGTNDRHNNTQEVLFNNLKTIYDYLDNLGIHCIFMSSLPSSVEIESEPIRNYHMEDVDNVVMKVCSYLNIEYISLYKEIVKYCQLKNIEIDTLLADGLHPNDSGYKVIFEIVIRKMGFGLKRDGATW